MSFYENAKNLVEALQNIFVVAISNVNLTYYKTIPTRIWIRQEYWTTYDQKLTHN